MKRKILLTGCAGFIGSNFVKRICTRADVKSNYDFVILDALTYAGSLENIKAELNEYPHLRFVHNTISDAKFIQEFFKEESFDGCLNFAAESHVDRSIANPNIFAETNVLGTLNLLNASLQLFNGGKKIRYLQVSTDEVYGSLGFDDTKFTESTPINPNSPYSSSKASADLFVRSFFETYKLPVVITRCSNNYGPYQYEEKLIPLALLRALNNQKIPVYGKGLNVRDWIYVDDHNDGIWCAFEKGVAGEVYNFGGDAEKSNIELVKLMLSKISLSEDLIEFVEDRKGHDLRYAIDFSKATRELGWKPKTSFAEGFDLTIAWYKNKWKL